jgi:polysaccharide pyruvyl transferase CsaB
MQAVLCGYYGYGNGGDEALLATLLQFLPPSISPVVLSSDPSMTATLHGVPTCNRNDWVAVFRLLQQSQVFIWGGGSLIQDSTSALSPWYYCGLMLLARLLGLKTIAWAQGIGPLERLPTQWIAQQTFRRCTAISVRDPGSLDWISRWRQTATTAPDPVWALAAQPTGVLSELPTPRLTVVLRAHPFFTAERTTQMAQALQIFVAQTKAFIVLLPFQKSQDLQLAQTLQAQLIEYSQVVQLTDPRQLKGVFQGVEMVIAMRLHGLMMAAAEGCRCFGISYDPKVQRLMEEIRCPGWDVKNLPTDATTMAQQWLQTWKAPPSLSVVERQQFAQRAAQHQQLLTTVLTSKS